MTAISITFFSTSCILLNTVGLSIYKYSRFPERGLQLLNGMSFYNNHIGRITTILFISVAIASSLLALGEFSQ